MSATVGVGVIGCGYWGPNLVRNFASTDGARVASVCDAQVERAAKLASLYSIPDVTSDAAALIANPEVDLVVVATPSLTHYPLARAAIEAGKHVLVMKPMTTRLADAEDLVDRARRRGVMLGVDHTFVYTSAVRAIREMIDTGHLGELYYIDSVRINLGVFQSDVNVVWDLGAHDVSIIDYLMRGETPTEVSAIGAAHAGSLRENVAYLTMRYGPSVLAHVHVNWLAPAKIRRTIVGGSKQMAVYDDMHASEKLAIYDKGVTIAPWDDAETVYSQLVSYRSGDMRVPRLDSREALAVEAEEIVECIRHGGSPVADAQSGLRTVRILEAAELSMKDGSRPIRLMADPPLTAIPIVSTSGSNGGSNGLGDLLPDISSLTAESA